MKNVHNTNISLLKLCWRDKGLPLHFRTYLIYMTKERLYRFPRFFLWGKLEILGKWAKVSGKKKWQMWQENGMWCVSFFHERVKLEKCTGILSLIFSTFSPHTFFMRYHNMIFFWEDLRRLDRSESHRINHIHITLMRRENRTKTSISDIRWWECI